MVFSVNGRNSMVPTFALLLYLVMLKTVSKSTFTSARLFVLFWALPPLQDAKREDAVTNNNGILFLNIT